MNGMTYCFKPNQERSSCSFHGRKNTQCTGQKPVGIRQKQKSSPDKSDELEYDGLIISKLDSDLSVPYEQFTGWNWHLFITRGYKRLSRLQRAIPSAFLDKFPGYKFYRV